MADFRGAGGGGGTAVVPASVVVASDREDYPLTRQGLIDAIAALPAGGGDIYVGAGSLTLDLSLGAITIDRDVKIFGAGVGATIFNCSGAGSLFNKGDFHLEFVDIQFTGDNGVSDQQLVNATASSSKPVMFTRCGVGTHPELITAGFRTIFDHNSFDMDVFITDCWFNVFCAGTPTASYFIKAATTGSTYRIENTPVGTGGQIQGTPGITISNSTIIAFHAGETMALGSTNAVNSAFTVHAGGSFSATGMVMQGGGIAGFAGTLPITINGGRIVNANLSGAITAGGDGLKISNCAVVSFESDTFGSHTIQGCTFSGAGDNVTLTDSSGNVVTDNLGVQVLEAGTSDSNYYTKIGSDSTLVGALSVVGDAQEVNVEVLISNVADTTYGTSGNRYIPIAKNATEQYVAAQFRATRAGKPHIRIKYAPSVSNGGDVVFATSGLASSDGDDPDAALGSLGSTTFTPGAGATVKSLSIDPSLAIDLGDNVFLEVLRSNVAGDTHTGSMNILTVSVLVW